jgi:hypothetical protein
MRLLGLGLGDRVPAAKTIWLFREHLTQTKAVENLRRRVVQHGQTAFIAGLQTAGARGHHVAGCATRTSFAGHPGSSTKARHALTFKIT